MTQERWRLAAMLASVCIVGITMLIDERRVFEAALDTLRDEQVTLATAVAADFESRSAGSRTATRLLLPPRNSAPG